jgi:hypothetical protein
MTPELAGRGCRGDDGDDGDDERGGGGAGEERKAGQKPASKRPG